MIEALPVLCPTAIAVLTLWATIDVTPLWRHGGDGVAGRTYAARATEAFHPVLDFS